MDVQIPLLIIDRKEFWVMSAHYRTCGVTRLRIITLLSTSMNRDEREIYRKCFGIFEIVSEDENGNVPYYFLWAAHLELFRVGGSHISVTWMHAKVPHFVYMASEWIVHMACEWVVFKGSVSGGLVAIMGLFPSLVVAGHLRGGSPLALLLPSPLWPPSHAYIRSLWCSHLSSAFHTLWSSNSLPLSPLEKFLYLSPVVLRSGRRSPAEVVNPYAWIPAEGSCFRSSNGSLYSRGWEV